MSSPSGCVLSRKEDRAGKAHHSVGWVAKEICRWQLCRVSHGLPEEEGVHLCNQHVPSVSSVPGLALSTKNTAVTLTELPDQWGPPETNGDDGAVWIAS